MEQSIRVGHWYSILFMMVHWNRHAWAKCNIGKGQWKGQRQGISHQFSLIHLGLM